MVLGDAATDPTPAQVQAMQGIVRQAMDEGAMGVASALIYAPGVFAKTPELIALAHAAGRCGGLYATHLRSEGDGFLASIDAAIAIGRAARTQLGRASCRDREVQYVSTSVERLSLNKKPSSAKER